jgi:hypothetical protein
VSLAAAVIDRRRDVPRMETFRARRIEILKAGPLNYIGVSPKIHCNVPQPSK